MSGCPRCNSYNISLSFGRVKCNNCSYSWKPRKENKRSKDRYYKQATRASRMASRRNFSWVRMPSGMSAISTRLILQGISLLIVLGAYEIDAYIGYIPVNYRWSLYIVYFVSGFLVWNILDDIILKPLVRRAEGGAKW